MDNEAHRDRQLRRGNAAKALLESETFRECMDELRRYNYEQYCITGNADDDLRRALWAKRQALDAVVGQLEQFVNEAKAVVHEREAERMELGGRPPEQL